VTINLNIGFYTVEGVWWHRIRIFKTEYGEANYVDRHLDKNTYP